MNTSYVRARSHKISYVLRCIFILIIWPQDPPRVNGGQLGALTPKHGNIIGNVHHILPWNFAAWKSELHYGVWDLALYSKGSNVIIGPNIY